MLRMMTTICNPMCQYLISKITLSFLTTNEDSFIFDELGKHIRWWQYPIFLLEASSIAPLYFFLYALVHFCENWFKIVDDKSFEGWISLTRFKSKKLDRIFCDWCSIVNGVNEKIYDQIIKDVKEKNFDKYKLVSENQPLYFRYLLLLKYIPYTIFHTHKKKIELRKEQLELLKNINDVNARKKIKTFLIWKNNTDVVEMRWCPFKYIREMKYDRENYVYRSDESHNLKIAGEILRTQGIIECTNCVKIINDHKDIIKTKKKTLFDDFVKVLHKKISNKLKF